MRDSLEGCLNSIIAIYFLFKDLIKDSQIKIHVSA